MTGQSATSKPLPFEPSVRLGDGGVELRNNLAAERMQNDSDRTVVLDLEILWRHALEFTLSGKTM